MNNSPLLYAFDPTIRPYVRDMTTETAMSLAEEYEGEYERWNLEGESVVAQGIYKKKLLTCDKWSGYPYRCWYGRPGLLIDYVEGNTPDVAISRAMEIVDRT